MTTTGTSQLDVHAAACLAGGADRVVDAALAALVETGRVRVSRAGLLTVLDRRSRDEVVAAVLDAVGARGHRTAGLVRQRAGADPRVAAVAGRLVDSGLLAPRRRGGTGPTRAGRRLLRQLRQAVPPRPAEPADLVPLSGVPAGTSAGRVALHGPDAMPDAELRAALFESSRPQRLRRTGMVVGRRRGSDRLTAHAKVVGRTSQYGAMAGWGSWGGGHGGYDGGGGDCGGGGGGAC